MSEISNADNLNNTERYSNKDTSRNSAIFGYLVLVLGVVAALVLVILFGVPGYFYG